VLVCTGAEPEPEGHTRPRSADNRELHTTPNHRSKSTGTRGLSKKELRGVEGLIITNKRRRVPPTAFSMKQMGGQNEPLPPSHEEKIRLQELEPVKKEPKPQYTKRRKTVAGSVVHRVPQHPQCRSKSMGRKCDLEGNTDGSFGDVDMVRMVSTCCSTLCYSSCCRCCLFFH
jgi:hypothetical protein